MSEQSVILHAMSNPINQKTDYFIRENFDTDFKADQAVIVTTDLLSLITDDRKEKQDLSEDRDWYPLVNSYYSFSEDVDAFARVSHLLANEYEEPSPSYSFQRFVEPKCFNLEAAQNKYLASNPISFIILGKPGVGEQELGKKLADYWQCVYIDPEVLIKDEIESDSRAGQCIEFNLRCGRAIGIDVILRLLDKRLKCQTVLHRGFVLCGLPVIANDLYEEDPVSSETAIFTVQEIFEDILDSVIEISIFNRQPQVSASSKGRSRSRSLKEKSRVEEPEEKTENIDDEGLDEDIKEDSIKLPVDVGSTVFNICSKPDIGQDYDKQLNYIFSLLKKPFLIIYIACCTADVINKRKKCKFDTYSKRFIDLQMRDFNKSIYEKFQQNKSDDIIEGFIDTEYLDIGDINLLKTVSLPNNYVGNVASQLNNFHIYGLKHIERILLQHDNQYFVKVDGRTNTAHKFSLVKARLDVLPVHRVIQPSLLSNFESNIMQGESPKEQDEENLDDLSMEEYFQLLSKKQNISRPYKWLWSAWTTFCPVSMWEGIYTKGDRKLAVQFMNKIFFLANRDAYNKFCRNPRPYLLPPFPKFGNKIFVFGPPQSGENVVAECLGYLVNSPVLSPFQISSNYKKEKSIEFYEKLKQAAIAEGLSILNDMRHNEAIEKERNRILEKDEWLQKVITCLIQIIEVFKKEIDELLISSFPLLMKSENAGSIKSDLIKELFELGIYEPLNLELCEKYLENEEKLLSLMPDRLLHPIEMIPAEIFDEFVQDYVDKKMNESFFDDSAIDDDIQDMFLSSVKEAEENVDTGGGWVIQGMICNLELLNIMIHDYKPHEVIVLQDTSNNFEYLLDTYWNVARTELFDLRDFLLDVNKVEAALRAPPEVPLRQQSTTIVDSILCQLLDELYFPYYRKYDISEEVGSSSLRDYETDLLNFRKTWPTVSKYLDDNNVHPIEIAVTDKHIDTLLRDVIECLESKYRAPATEVTEQELAEEVKFSRDQGIEDEEEIGEHEPADNFDELLQQNRRYGETGYYCPVVLSENGVLWKGKEEFAAKFENATYLLSSSSALQKFLSKPVSYLPSIPCKIPPIRICIVGVDGVEKYAICKHLYKQLGVNFVDYEKYLIDYFNLNDIKRFNDVRVNKDLSTISLFKYLNNNTELPEESLEFLKQIWYEGTYKSNGFVLRNFPKRPSDLKYVIENKLIPDLIINITPNLSSRSKLLEKRFNEWKIINTKQAKILEQTNAKLLEEWTQKREERFKKLMEDRRQVRYSAKKVSYVLDEEDEEIEPEENIDVISQISFDSIAEQKDTDDVIKLLDVEMPEIKLPQLETELQAKQRIETEVEDTYQIDIKYLNEIKNICAGENIKWLDVNQQNSLEKTIWATFIATDYLSINRHAMFETCYVTDQEEAEKLLNCGYYFLTEFGKICPVQYSENLNPIPMYYPLLKNNVIFPIIYRQHIYYLGGEKALIKFKKDPLKYVNVPTVKFPLIPFRIAVSGPPKCGKTILAEKFEKHFNLKLVSRGAAARYVLDYLPHSDLAENMEIVLRRGWELTDEMVVRSVQAACFDSRAVTQGVIFDGFPCTMYEVRHMSYYGLVPNLVIDLVADRSQVMECLSFDTGKRNFPVFSEIFVNHLYDEWEEYGFKFQKWLDREYQNMAKIEIDTCNWSVWKQAFELVLAVCSEIQHYHIHAKDDWPLRISNMLISPLEFVERMSSFKQYCPCCLHFTKNLNYGGDPPDRTGLIQYLQHFYWLCSNHILLFLKQPDRYLPPYNNNKLPQFLPTQKTFKHIPQNCYLNGACIVCRVKKKKIVQGLLSNCIELNETVYLMDTEECFRTFLSMSEKILKMDKETVTCNFSSVDYHNLPTLGLLEQYVAKYIITALELVVRHRPLVPGLSVATSAAIAIGLHLKQINSNIDDGCKEGNKRAMQLFEQRRQSLVDCLEKMKSMINPFLYYEDVLPQFVVPESVTSVSTVVGHVGFLFLMNDSTICVNTSNQ